MMELGALAFTEPWLLAALALLPGLWWLLRVTPPAPRQVRFPAIRLLFGLKESEETAAHTPLWLVILRLAAATVVILALAHPLFNPSGGLRGSGPLVLVIDNGWGAAPEWTARLAALEGLLDAADRARRPVVVLPTAPPATGEAIVASGPLTVADARRIVQALEPLPWPVDRAGAARALDGLRFAGSAEAVWLSDGMRIDESDAAVSSLAERLQRLGGLRVLTDSAERRPHLLRPPTTEGLTIDIQAVRAVAEMPERIQVLGRDIGGGVLVHEAALFEAGAASARVSVTLPVELHNKIGRWEIENEASAGAVVLVDERWRRRPLGMVSGRLIQAGDSLLDDLYYVDRALRPFSEVRRGTIGELLRRELAVMVLADTGPLAREDRLALEPWLERGGVAVRFAGPRLAQGGDDFTPVVLRAGGRDFGGAMSWTRPAKLAPFDEASPFAGVRVPDEVVIRRQVLAEPSLDLAGRTWARLSDGTPLVTAERRGRGWLVLVHTTANTDWSNLALSGLFVEMLRRVVALSQGVAAADGSTALAPLETLDGFGRLGRPSAAAAPVRFAGEEADRLTPGPSSPPGYYGSEAARRAFNLSEAVAAPVPFGPLPAGIEQATYAGGREVDAKPWLLAAALALLVADILATLALRGLLHRLGAAGAAAGLAFLLLLAPGPATAQEAAPSEEDAAAIAATQETRLAFVVTGVPVVDDVSRAGLVGLGRVLRRRTAVEPGPPVGANLERDELAFYPLLYWPVTQQQRPPSQRAIRKINAFLRAGGMIVFDTRDQEIGEAGLRRLRQLVRGLEVPPLVPVPDDHVLTRSFYLLQDFPGRWIGSGLWVEQGDLHINDGVSSVLIGGNDWAGAWAIDELGRAMFPVVPGGERQREMAFRTGINIVMYALSGNYKADQVHLPAILERLGL